MVDDGLFSCVTLSDLRVIGGVWGNSESVRVSVSENYVVSSSELPAHSHSAQSRQIH